MAKAKKKPGSSEPAKSAAKAKKVGKSSLKKVTPKKVNAAKKPAKAKVEVKKQALKTKLENKKEEKVAKQPVKPVVATSVPKPVKESKKSKEDLKEEQELMSDDTYSWSSSSFSDMKNYEPTSGFRKPDPPQPKFKGKKDDRTRYTDKELEEFREIINEKIAEAEKDYELLKNTLSHRDEQGTDDTSPTFKVLEDGSDAMSREEVAQLASRQEKHIQNLKNALIRIENKTYGICRVTGKLIPKERLRSVPHATLSIEAKLVQNS